MDTSILTKLLEEAVSASKTDAEAFLSFTKSYHESLHTQLQKTTSELAETKDVAKKLAEGVKKYKGALTNLQKVLASANED
jgi:hypothetical protein